MPQTEPALRAYLESAERLHDLSAAVMAEAQCFEQHQRNLIYVIEQMTGWQTSRRRVRCTADAYALADID